MMEVKNNVLILSFLRRYWVLVILTVVMNLACQSEDLFRALGALLYIPAVASLVAMLAYLIRHCIFRETIDKEAGDGTFTREWRRLDPRDRVYLTVIITCVIFLGVALIAAGVGR